MWKVLVSAFLVAFMAVLLIFCEAESSDCNKYKEWSTIEELSSASSPVSTLSVSPGFSSKSPTNSLNSSEFLMACNTDNDMDCLGKSTELFLKQTSKGIPDRNILAIDPFVLPSLDLVFDKNGLVFLNNNVNVTGLEHQKIFDFKMNTTAKSVVLTTKADIMVSGDIIFIFTKLSKLLILRGNYTAFATISGKAEYDYDLRTDDKGVEYFVVSPETISCKVVNIPQVKLNPELEKILLNDTYANASSVIKTAELAEITIRKIAEKAYKNVIHNIRQAATFLPASAFFKNLHNN